MVPWFRGYGQGSVLMGKLSHLTSIKGVKTQVLKSDYLNLNSGFATFTCVTWVNSLISLNLSFLVCKMGMIRKLLGMALHSATDQLRNLANCLAFLSLSVLICHLMSTTCQAISSADFMLTLLFLLYTCSHMHMCIYMYAHAYTVHYPVPCAHV